MPNRLPAARSGVRLAAALGCAAVAFVERRPSAPQGSLARAASSPSTVFETRAAPAAIPTGGSARRLRPRAPQSPRCADGMVVVEGRFCIDAYEASSVEVKDDGTTVPHSPYLPVTGLRVRAVSRPGVIPQAYINQLESDGACRQAGKRLCTDDEWVEACRGPGGTRYPYGDERRPGYCVDTNRTAPLPRVFGGTGIDYYRYVPMNDERLNQVPGTVAPTGTFPRCTNAFRVYDMVGNVHEWTSSPSGTFRGGYYLDTKINGEGCLYRTIAHAGTYHDYSTGFRCCADVRSSGATRDDSAP